MQLTTDGEIDGRTKEGKAHFQAVKTYGLHHGVVGFILGVLTGILI